MYSTRRSNQSLPSKNDHITRPVRFGKTDHDYAKIKHEHIDELEDNETTKLQKDDKLPLSTAAAHAAIMKIESELRLLCSLQVPNASGSPNPDLQPSNCTTLESSFELPIEDSLFLQEILGDIQQSSKLEDADWLSDLPIELLNQFPSSDPQMTFTDITDISMEQENEYVPEVGMNTSVSSGTNDETVYSSASSVSDDTERDDINRRGLKKSGGPLRKIARFGNKQVIKYSNEYHDRRVKNNEAVKKSRLKAKDKQKESEQKMNQLAKENRSLNDRVDLLMKELHVLKSLYKELNQDLPASAVRALEKVNVR